MYSQVIPQKLNLLSDYSFEKINFSSFTEKDWGQLLSLDELIEHEMSPKREYSPILGKRMFSIERPGVYVEYWIVRSIKDSSQIVGYAMYNVLTPEASDYPGNGNKVRTWIVVHPQHRRKKIGSSLLKILCHRGIESGKTELTASTSLIDGQKFFKRFTDKTALDSAENELDLEQINWDEIKKWNNDSKESSPDTVIETYESLRDDLIEEYAQVQTSLLNDIPFGNLGLSFIISADQIRKWGNYTKKLGFISIIKVSREKDGRISGLTEIKFNHLTPTLIEQELTGVLQKYRGRRLGLRLKTDMLLTIKERFPEAKIILTGNADENAPMLRINHQLGFKRAFSWKAYRFQLKELIEKI